MLDRLQEITSVKAFGSPWVVFPTVAGLILSTTVFCIGLSGHINYSDGVPYLLTGVLLCYLPGMLHIIFDDIKAGK